MAVSTPTIQSAHFPATTGSTLYDKLNSTWHERALQVFMAIVLAHWGEHLFQAYQIYVMGWPRPKANGLLGLWYPWLIKSEVLHYGYALVMLIGIWVLRKGFTGTGRTWWTVALVIQFWHHIEHLLLITQATMHHNFWGKPVPVSVLQLFVPRVELHLFYNTLVFIPMVIGMYYHMFPPKGEEGLSVCSCEWNKETRGAKAQRCIASIAVWFPILRCEARVRHFMVRDRISHVAVSLLLLHASSLASSCSKSSGTSNDIAFACEIDPTPSRVGKNTFTVTLTAGGGDRLAGAHISLEGDMSHPGMSPVFSETKEIGPGRYQGTLDLNMRGDWSVLFHVTLPSGRTFDRQVTIRNIQAT